MTEPLTSDTLDAGITLQELTDWQEGCDLTSFVDETISESSARTLAARPATDSTLLADHTTFRIGGRAKSLVIATTEAELVDAVKSADAAGEPLLVLSGGSNMLVADADFDGTVVKVATTGLEAEVSSCGGAVVTVEAGERWDDFVAYAIDQEWYGIEALSGIPGLVGTTPVQNVGAYGAEVKDVVYRVRTLDRLTGEFTTFPLNKCEFSYRNSVFKRTRMPGSPTGRYVVVQVWFQFNLGSLSAPIRYVELANRLGVQVGDRAPAREVREAVLDIRRGKGMVLDDADRDTWSAGSFFTNPILDAVTAARLPEGAPRFDAGDGMVKTSAAWLIDHAGFGKGFSVTPDAPASLSTKHVLALTNRGDATSDDVITLARTVRDGVEQAYGIRLVPEPVLVGLDL